jgi:hypothetical protein
MLWNLSSDDMQNLVLIVKGVPGFGTPDDRKAIIESALGLSQRAKDAVGSLDLNGASDVVAQRVIRHLASFGKLESGEETLELFLIKSVATRVDLDVGEEISNILSRSRVVPPKPRWPPPPPGDFDPRIEDVKKAIRTNLNKIKNCKILDENENEVWTLDLLATELECDAPQPGEDLREHLASFLTTRCIDTDLMSLVRVLKLLYKQGMGQDAERIGEIVDLMLPLCLPRKILSEAWRQIKDHGAVLIQTPVAKKTGAQILVAGLHRKPAKFKKSLPEPIGQQLVPLETNPIGDPNWKVESALRDLYIATFSAEVKEDASRSVDIYRLPRDQIKMELRGHYRARKDAEKIPCYCVVELATNEADRRNQAILLAGLGIPELLFIGLARDSETREFERYVITCLNTRFESEEKGKPA